MTTIDHIYELRYRREMSEIARALGLDPGKVAESDALTAILDAISTRHGLLDARDPSDRRECVIRTKEADGDAAYWYGRYEELCAEIDALREGRADVWREGFQEGYCLELRPDWANAPEINPYSQEQNHG